jgi:hypothetical protein
MRTTSLKAALVMTLGLVACGPRAATSDAEDTISARLAQFEQDCGFEVSVPTTADGIRQTFAEMGARTYEVTPSLNGRSGDNVFPMTKAAEFDHEPVSGAVVVICPGDDPRILGARSPRFAFYFDEAGNVFHVEEHSLYTG